MIKYSNKMSYERLYFYGKFWLTYLLEYCNDKLEIVCYKEDKTEFFPVDGKNIMYSLYVLTSYCDAGIYDKIVVSSIFTNDDHYRNRHLWTYTKYKHFAAVK